MCLCDRMEYMKYIGFGVYGLPSGKHRALRVGSLLSDSNSTLLFDSNNFRSGEYLSLRDFDVLKDYEPNDEKENKNDEKEEDNVINTINHGFICLEV